MASALRNLCGLFLKMFLGRNSAVKSTMIVDTMVSTRSFIAGC